mmetsp:Transcript_77394/g.226971  ORF Transcript_77394/g.226971 Transcript_77394/m.226971 type:complete len:293 (-) Transcript_77394:748-1626(-)
MAAMRRGWVTTTRWGSVPSPRQSSNMNCGNCVDFPLPVPPLMTTTCEVSKAAPRPSRSCSTGSLPTSSFRLGSSSGGVTSYGRGSASGRGCASSALSSSKPVAGTKACGGRQAEAAPRAWASPERRRMAACSAVFRSYLPSSGPSNSPRFASTSLPSKVTCSVSPETRRCTPPQGSLAEARCCQVLAHSTGAWGSSGGTRNDHRRRLMKTSPASAIATSSSQSAEEAKTCVPWKTRVEIAAIQALPQGQKEATRTSRRRRERPSSASAACVAGSLASAWCSWLLTASAQRLM